MTSETKETRRSRGGPVSPSVRVVHPNAAGVDLGSRAHYVAVPADRCSTPVRRFGCLTPELHAMARWLRECRIETVALEATGVYWVPVVQVLESQGLEVLVVDAGHVKQVPGRKSDVADSQWLQELHTFGLLRGAFRPEQAIRILRTYWRQREDLVEQCARQIHLMQKALEQMNLQLHKVLSDITGQSGLSILRAILAGQRDPAQLAALTHARVKSSQDTIAQALTGEYREEWLFTLRQAMELYDIFQAKIADCDRTLQAYLATLEPKTPAAEPSAVPVSSKPVPRRRKNQVHFDLASELVRITGVDLTRIDGISTLTAQTILSECGWDLKAFPTEKHFASWLGLCPNHRITGGKIKSRRTRKVAQRAAKALRLAAWSLERSGSALGAFFRRIKTRVGAPKAITATAHKLARLVYRMLKYGQAYVDQGQEYYNKKYEEQQILYLKKKAQRMGLALVVCETGEVVS